MGIIQNVRLILSKLPPGVEVVAAVKGRSPQEIAEAIDGGIKIIGENYVKQSEQDFKIFSPKVKWHMIGHLQQNKVRTAASIFDMIETVDSLELARALSKECVRLNKEMPILIEVNIAHEARKSGVAPEETLGLITQTAKLPGLKVKGVMTMGPNLKDPESLRPYFAQTRSIFEEIANLHIPGVEMTYLSMGMSNSYRIAIEEGANLVRLGRSIFDQTGRLGPSQK